MKHIFIIIISLLLISCISKQENKQKELELKQRELDLKEKELNMLEKSKNQAINRNDIPKTTNPKQKELRYLFYANGGLTGYFNDGTFVTCPRCDFCKTNILSMFNGKPDGTYIVQSDGSLLINNSDREFPILEKDNGWALINYEWNEKVPQE